jgi:hypothetical protein
MHMFSCGSQDVDDALLFDAVKQPVITRHNHVRFCECARGDARFRSNDCDDALDETTLGRPDFFFASHPIHAIVLFHI